MILNRQQWKTSLHAYRFGATSTKLYSIEHTLAFIVNLVALRNYFTVFRVFVKFIKPHESKDGLELYL